MYAYNRTFSEKLSIKSFSIPPSSYLVHIHTKCNAEILIFYMHYSKWIYSIIKNRHLYFLPTYVLVVGNIF